MPEKYTLLGKYLIIEPDKKTGERSKFAEKMIVEFKDKRLRDSHWERLDNLLNQEKKGTIGLQAVAKTYFREAKEHLIHVLDVDLNLYKGIWNWTCYYSDFQYAINGVKFWAEVCHYFGILK